MKRAALLVIPALLLTACGDTRPILILPPAELASCSDEPLAPDLPGRDQQRERDLMTLDYILGLRSAYGDCKAKVDGLAAWRAEAGS